jgi:hypothetical protein
MDVVRTFDALRASARSGQTFPRWWCLDDRDQQEQASTRPDLPALVVSRASTPAPPPVTPFTSSKGRRASAIWREVPVAWG